MVFILLALLAGANVDRQELDDSAVVIPAVEAILREADALSQHASTETRQAYASRVLAEVMTLRKILVRTEPPPPIDLVMSTGAASKQSSFELNATS